MHGATATLTSTAINLMIEPEPILNWNTLDEQWNLRHEPAAFATLESTLDGALFRHVEHFGYPLLWRWARMSHFRAMQADEDKRQEEAIRHWEAGAHEAQSAIPLQPHRVEGHFWLGVNALEAARRRGAIAAARAVPKAAQSVERAMNIDEEYHFGGPLRVWARITHLKPLILGGSIDRALDIYRRALQVAPYNSTTLLYYSQCLLADQQKPLARTTLQSIIDAPDDPEWRWEQNRDRRLAQELITKMNG